MPKYATPQDVQEPTGNYTPPRAGSAIRVDGKPVKFEGYAKQPSERIGRNPLEGRAKPPADDAETSNTNAMGDTYKKGGMTRSSASKRADGIAARGKTRGRLL
jgi:hypothetical protein